uniref:Uncharacterized protein n=1 Tax=Arundo donax TaxID=35708 RepID=A0A0A9FE85_ARUDO
MLILNKQLNLLNLLWRQYLILWSIFNNVIRACS